VYSLDISIGLIKVCFELGTPGFTPAGEYFLGFLIESTNDTYVAPQQIPLHVVSTPIPIIIPSDIECIAGGYSVPIQLKIPYNPYNELKLTLQIPTLQTDSV